MSLARDTLLMLACLAPLLALAGCAAAEASTAVMSTGPLKLSLGSEPTVRSMVEALQQRHRAPLTVTFTQRAVRYGASGAEPEQTMDEWLRFPGWLRIDLTDPEPTVLVFHPEGRSLFTAAGRRDAGTGSTVMLLMLDVFGEEVGSWLSRAAAAGLDATLISKQEWDGGHAWVLGAKPGQIDRTQLWLDGSTLLPLRYLEVQQGRGGQTVVIEGRASQYRDFDGVSFHTDFEFYQDGELVLVEEYDDVVVNGGIPDEMFDLEAIARQFAAGADNGQVGAGAALLPPGVLLPLDAGLSAVSPHVAVGLADDVAVTYAVENEIWVSVSPSGGEQFGAPVHVGGSGRLVKGMTRGPKVALNNQAMVIVGICGEKLMGQDGDLLAWRSTDKGATWSGPVPVNDVAAAAREGLSAIAAAADGRMLCVWLDLRNDTTELWGAWSHDGGASWGENVALYRSPDGKICPCCHPTVSFDPRTGDGVIMWRNALAGNRDMYLARIADGVVGSAELLGWNHWALEGCPVAGGGLAVSADGDIFTAWRRRSELLRAAPGAGEAPLGKGQNVRVGVGPGGPSYLWLAEGALRGTVAGKPVQLGEGKNPWLASAPDGMGPVVAVWESGGKTLGFRVLERR